MVEVLGRQPAVVRYTPSNPFDWYGAIEGGEKTKWGWLIGGGKFTLEQQRTLKQRDLDAEAVETIEVRRLALHREASWGTGPRPCFAFDCPVLSRRKTGEIEVIAPAGTVKLVKADGWVAGKAKGNWK